MYKGYIAGALFNEAEVKQRRYEGEKLREVTGDKVEWYNPIEAPINDKSKLPTATDIFSLDTKKVIESDFIVADITNNDVGVAMELGIAYGLQYVAHLINKILEEYPQFKENEQLMSLVKFLYNQGVKYKHIFAVCSDIRLTTAGEYDGIHVPYGLNQYVIGGIESMPSTIVYSFESAVEEIERILNSLQKGEKHDAE